MMSRFKCCALLFGCVLALGLVATGCGNSSTTTLPPEPETPENPFLPATVGTDSTLEVMTWNLEHFAKNGSQTLDMVVLAISGLDVDIVGLQEIESSYSFDGVVSELEGWSGYRATSAGYNLNLAFLYRNTGLLQVDSIQSIMTDEGGPFPRRPLLLLGSFDGKPIAVINNHLKCCGDGLIDDLDNWDEETRRRDACLLLEEYVLANLGNRQVFLVGDFNDEVTDPMDNNVFANFLGDPQRWAVSDLVIAQGSSSGWSFPGWPSHLDHIIINQPLFEAANGPDAEILVVPLFAFLSNGWSQYDQDISDHLPVVLKLKP